MTRPKTKPGIGSMEDGTLDPTSSERAGVVIANAPHQARFDTDPRLALRPAAEQALVRGLVPATEEEPAGLPAVDAMASAAKNEAKLLRLERKAPEGDESGERPALSDLVVQPEVDAPTTPRAKRRGIGSTTAGLRAASKDLTKFAFAAVGLALGAYALIWWWASRPSSRPNEGAPTSTSSATSPELPTSVTVVAPTLTPPPSATGPSPTASTAASASAKAPLKPHSPSTASPVTAAAPPPSSPPIVPAPKPSATGDDDPLRIKGI